MSEQKMPLNRRRFIATSALGAAAVASGLAFALAGLPSLELSPPEGVWPPANARGAAMTDGRSAAGPDSHNAPVPLPAPASPVPELSGVKLLGHGLFVAVWIASRRISRN